jgi:UDP-glucose 4-epimerase
MKILITGGAGYIAKKVAESLKEHDVTLLTRADLDLTDQDACRIYFYNRSFDVIIHTAIQGGSRLKEDDDKVLENNIKMYYNLINSGGKYAKFISFGSGAELGHPTDYYGLSKHVIAKSMLAKPNCFNIRIYAVFDYDELDTRFIKSNIIRYINKEDMVIHQNKFMDFFYMEDLISVIKYYINEKNPPKEFNCTYLESRTLLQIAEMIDHLDKHRVGINVLKDGLGEGYIGKWDGLVLPLVGLEQGIRNTYNIIKSQL